MKTIKIPDEKIDLFREWFDASLPTFNDYQVQINPTILKNLYNITDEKAIQTSRGQVKDKKMHDEIMSCVSEFGIHPWVSSRAYINFARGFLPIAIHVDIPADDTNNDGDTILIPLTFNDKIKTIFWKEQVYEPVFDYWVEKQDWSNRKKMNNLRERFDLSNGFYWKPEIIDYMEVEGIGEWFKGNCWCGRRSQPHGSTNFRASGITHKDYILIQTTDQYHRR